MTNVVTLRNEPVSVNLDPVPEVVDLLSNLLERAKSGELRRVAIVAEWSDPALGFDEYVLPGASRSVELNTIIAGLNICLHGVVAASREALVQASEASS